jgi:hypothetical protein
MIQGDDTKTSTGQLLTGAVQVLAIVIIGLLAAAIVTAFTEHLASAQLLATIAAAFATVLLAALVGWYASATQAAAETSRKYQRRPYVKRIVATGIDHALSWLVDNRSRWAVEDPPAGMPVYPELEGLDVTDDVVADLGRDHPEVVETVSEFLTATRKYNEEWQTLRAALRDELRTLDFEASVDSIDDLVPEESDHLERGDDVDPEQSPEAFVRDHPDLFARYVLENPGGVDPGPVVAGEGYARLLLDANRMAFMQLRGRDAVADQVDLLHRHREELREDAAEVEERLQDVRAEYVQTYDLLETELGEVRDGGRTAV